MCKISRDALSIYKVKFQNCFAFKIKTQSNLYSKIKKKHQKLHNYYYIEINIL